MPKLSVLIPHYNEKATLAELIEKVSQVPVDKEIILIDDASTDGSRDLIRRDIQGKYKNLKVLFHEKNLGKGAAIRTGLREASGEIILIQDADLEYDPRDYFVLCEPFDTKNADVVYGTRFKELGPGRFFKLWVENKFFGKSHELKSFHFFFGIQLLNVAANVLYGAGITDEATCYKAFRKKVLDRIHLRCEGFEFCPEVTAKVRKLGYTIVEVPVSYHPRTKKEGKKISWHHGFEAIGTLLKYRFTD